MALVGVSGWGTRNVASSIATILLMGISLVAAPANAQGTRAKLAGVVRRPDGTPAAAALVVVDGQDYNAQTGADGRFSVLVRTETAGTVRAFQGSDSAAASFAAIPAGETVRSHSRSLRGA